MFSKLIDYIANRRWEDRQDKIYWPFYGMAGDKIHFSDGRVWTVPPQPTYFGTVKVRDFAHLEQIMAAEAA